MKTFFHSNIKFGFDWPSGLEKMFEYYGHIHVHVYSPGAGQTTHFLPLNDIFLFFPLQTNGPPKLTLPYDRSRSSQGHDLYNLCRAPFPDALYQVSKS